jgi:hypothetical protein
VNLVSKLFRKSAVSYAGYVAGFGVRSPQKTVKEIFVLIATGGKVGLKQLD